MPLTQQEREDEQRIMQLIRDTVRVAIAEAPIFPFCQLEKEHISQMENAISSIEATLGVFKKIVVGNGNPEDGLVWKQKQLELDLARISRQNVTRAEIENEIRDRSPFSKFTKYMADKILPGILVNVILLLFAFLYAVNQHLIVTKLP